MRLEAWPQGQGVAAANYATAQPAVIGANGSAVPVTYLTYANAQQQQQQQQQYMQQPYTVVLQPTAMFGQPQYRLAPVRVVKAAGQPPPAVPSAAVAGNYARPPTIVYQQMANGFYQPTIANGQQGEHQQQQKPAEQRPQSQQQPTSTATTAAAAYNYGQQQMQQQQGQKRPTEQQIVAPSMSASGSQSVVLQSL